MLHLLATACGKCPGCSEGGVAGQWDEINARKYCGCPTRCKFG